jgi:NAD(P)H-quinone oxidoreductase subunit 2
MEIKDLFASLNLVNLLPEWILVFVILLMLLVDLFSENKSKDWLFIFPVGGLGLCLLSFFVMNSLDKEQAISFLGSFQSDSISLFFRFLIALSSFISILLSFEYIKRTQVPFTEFFVLLLTACLGGMLLAGANDIVMIFLALETLGLSSYVLAGYMKKDLRSNEAGLKYLIVGALSSTLLLYAFSLFYGLSSGEIQVDKIAFTLNQTGAKNTLLAFVAFLLASAGIGFKIGLAPFHQWAPDVYEGSPTPVVAFLSVASKIAGLALAIRLINTIFPYLSESWSNVFQILAILSMLIGNLIAITQTSMKRMLSYSSIGQAGFLLIGLIAGNINGYTSTLVYIFLYIFMNLGAFACVILFGLKTGSDQIRDYAGLFSKDPILVLCFSICLLSLGGIPPLAGFFGKLYLFWAGWQAKYYTLVFIGLFTSVISIYYYLRIIKMMVIYQKPELSSSVDNYQKPNWSGNFLQPLELGLYICIFGSTLGGVLISPIIHFTEKVLFNTPLLKMTLAFIF